MDGIIKEARLILADPSARAIFGLLFAALLYESGKIYLELWGDKVEGQIVFYRRFGSPSRVKPEVVEETLDALGLICRLCFDEQEKAGRAWKIGSEDRRGKTADRAVFEAKNSLYVFLIAARNLGYPVKPAEYYWRPEQ